MNTKKGNNANECASVTLIYEILKEVLISESEILNPSKRLV